MVLLNKPFDKEAEYPDWNEVIKATDDFYSNKVENFLKSCELPSEIIMDPECDKMVNYRRWNRFYFLTGSVLFDTVEGGHRCTFAMRTCFGYPLYNALPLKDMCMNSDLKTRTDVKSLFATPIQASSVYQPLFVNCIFTKEETMKIPITSLKKSVQNYKTKQTVMLKLQTTNYT